MRINTLAVVGVGLLGGSVGWAARRRGVADRVVGVDRDPAVLREALGLGILDEACADLGVAGGAEVVVLCTPVDCIAAQVLAVAGAGRPGTLLTDVGSTKAAIVRAVEGKLPAGVGFVGSHPLAGSEKQGPGHASPDLFQGRQVVLTPTSRTGEEDLARAAAFWQALGAWVSVMEPEQHDRAMALTSHLPHLVASALAGILPADLGGLTASGFRDTTRTAGGDPGLWAAILEANREGVLEALAGLGGQLERFRQALAAGDRAALEALLLQGKKVRDSLPSQVKQGTTNNTNPTNNEEKEE
jgi:prephenate dehydrogenase